MEWEARGDGLRRAKRFDEAVEAYRRALRQCFQCFQSTRGLSNESSRACFEIREKIWCVQLDLFDSMIEAPEGNAPFGADVTEWNAAMRWAKGSREEAECLVQAAIARGIRSSGEFLDRLAARWIDLDPEGSLRLTDWACRLRLESSAVAARA